MNKKILLIITGSVACYKSMDLVRLLTKKNYEVNCILTNSACQFITPLLASSLSGTKTYNELFSLEDEVNIGHIKLSRKNDLIIIAPATADFIAKIANGYADDLASSVILASDKKIIVAPAMNEKMWHNPATQQNISKIIDRGISIIDPESDKLACQEYGIGKMASVENIVLQIESFFINKDLLKNKKILITGGATYEPIDPVRFIGNNSSGKQSIAIAKLFYEMGAEVKMICANINQEISIPKKNIINIKTATEMFDAVKNNLKWCNVFIGCAAVADFKVKRVAKEKIKKTDNKNLHLDFEKNVDILECVGKSKDRPKIVIGFCAESKNLKENTQKKLIQKNCDIVIGNDIENGEIFGSNQTKAIIVSKKTSRNLGKITKDELAKILADTILKL